MSSGFLYYLPQHATDTISPQQIVAAGLGYAFDNPGSKSCNPLHGAAPGGSGGAIIFDPARTPRNGYQPTLQTWQKHESAGYWVGMWKDDKPGPDALEKAKPLPGTPVELGDGKQWIVPQARYWASDDNPDAWPYWLHRLPRRVLFDTSGKDIALQAPSVEEAYAELWALSEMDVRIRYGEASEADKAELSGVRLFLNALRILSFNYCLGPVEANLLGLFTTESWQAIFDALNDAETWRGFIEKKVAAQANQPVTQSSSAGVADTPPSIDQPALT